MLGRRAAGLPIWFCLAVTGMCLLAKEFYPFSHFPMYSRNAPGTFCLYVSDANDRVLFTLPEFGTLSSVLKKMYNGKIQKYKVDGLIKRYSELTPELIQLAGGAVLQWLLEERKKAGKPDLPGVVRLMQEEYRLREGKIVKETSRLAEIPAVPASR